MFCYNFQSVSLRSPFLYNFLENSTRIYLHNCAHIRILYIHTLLIVCAIMVRGLCRLVAWALARYFMQIKILYFNIHLRVVNYMCVHMDFYTYILCAICVSVVHTVCVACLLFDLWAARRPPPSMRGEFEVAFSRNVLEEFCGLCVRKQCTVGWPQLWC